MNRRGFITGMAGILASGYSASVLPSGVIMPVRKLWTPKVIQSLSVSIATTSSATLSIVTGYDLSLPSDTIYAKAYNPNAQSREVLIKDAATGDSVILANLGPHETLIHEAGLGWRVIGPNGEVLVR